MVVGQMFIVVPIVCGNCVPSLFLMQYLPHFLFLSIGPVHFRFKACYAVFFMFIKIVMELSVSTQWIP